MSELKVTSASDYAKISKKKGGKGELVQMPSGAVFRMRRADFQSLMMKGAMPDSLMKVALKAYKEQGKLTDEMLEQVVDDLTAEVKDNPEEMNRNLIFAREIVKKYVLEPRIGYNELGEVALIDENGHEVAELTEDDFHYAQEWIMGKEGYQDGLDKFRPRRERRAVNAGTRKQKSGNAAQSVSAH